MEGAGPGGGKRWRYRTRLPQTQTDSARRGQCLPPKPRHPRFRIQPLSPKSMAGRVLPGSREVRKVGQTRSRLTTEQGRQKVTLGTQRGSAPLEIHFPEFPCPGGAYAEMPASLRDLWTTLPRKPGNSVSILTRLKRKCSILDGDGPPGPRKSWERSSPVALKAVTDNYNES